ncbi:MAG TPA: hypothetical protein VF141_04140 [Chryseolinea sp.]
MDQTQTARYDRASLLSIGIVLVLLWGFYRTYIVFFPSFEGFVFVQHFHGIMMSLWMACLIAQPLLISRKKYQIHKLIGKISFVLAPLLMISIFGVSKMTFERNLAASTMEDAVAGISLSIPGLIIFAVLYGLAIKNRPRTYYHMRYMIGTALLMIGPGLGRVLILYFEMPPPIGISITLAAVSVLAVTLLVLDLIKKQDYKPFLIVTALMVLQSLLWEIRYTALWQGVGEVISKFYLV